MLGFKSFCEKTHLTFSGTGITAIVGPNGCGKSNVVDAISWVLGEQSHKSLRAMRMTDCIFNGTAKRTPLGFAEVSLTLVDPELAEAAAFVMQGQPTEAQDAPGFTATDEELAEASGGEEPGALDAGVDAAAATVGEVQAQAGNTPPFKKRKQPKPAMHLKPGEVVIGRRLYRSGQSDYLLNGRVARLRDIQELFMGTGLGPESYAIIEQGRIGQILSSKPMDRRAIIEEAAGVSKYKTKKRLAETKLESSKLNLSRVNDILVEVEKQLGSLKRQASKARRYAEIREAMRGIQRTVLASKARELESEAERIIQAVNQASAAEHEAAAAVQRMEGDQERLHARTYELEGELRRNGNLLGECALELDRAENRISFNRERMQQMDQRAGQLAAEASQAATHAAEATARVEAHAANVTAARAEAQRAEGAAVELATAMAAMQQEQAAAEERIGHLRRAAQNLHEELNRLHGEQAQAEVAYAHFTELRAKAERKVNELAGENARQQERMQECEARYQRAAGRAQTLAEAVRSEQAQISELRARQAETAERNDRLRESLAGARARQGSLTQILHEHSYSADAVQKLFAANGEGEGRRFRAVGLLADYAEVEEHHETAVEQFLREELEFVVVETFEQARAGISLLRNEGGGRATFFVDSLHQVNLQEGEAPAPWVPEGVLARLDRLVNFRTPLGEAAKQFLPRLRSAFLVETPQAAEKLACAHKDSYFLTPDGTCYHGRLVSGGRAGDTGPLAMKRELRTAESEVTRLEAAAGEAQSGLDWVQGELRRHEEAQASAGAAHLTAEKELVAATHMRDAAGGDGARLQQQRQACEAEVAHLAAETEAARRRSEQARETREGATQTRAQAESEAMQAAHRVNALRTEIAAQQEAVVVRRAEQATMAERLAAAEAVAARLGAEWEEGRAREATLRGQIASLDGERREAEIGSQHLLTQTHNLGLEKARLSEEKARLEQEFEQSRVRAVELDDVLRVTRNQLGDLRERRSQHEIERARNESDRNHLRETCLSEVNAHPEDLLATETALLTGEELAVADASYREMKEKIEAMGAVNMMALEEYQECEQRYTFLARERDDLVKSIEDTRQTINELDATCAQRFADAFAVINRNFSQAFTTLFGGGAAEMRMGEADSTGEPGIDIIASPPGKRLQNVLLLSGGEKALTAVSLLIAIFRYTPSPFCILDEVDAPLDEANVGRFNKLLGEMSSDTQFIIITHNRRTMEMAPVLYGVTMQEPGVSKMVSVRWDETQTNAA
jgi:chromosome segregation protein